MWFSSFYCSALSGSRHLFLSALPQSCSNFTASPLCCFCRCFSACSCFAHHMFLSRASHSPPAAPSTGCLQLCVYLHCVYKISRCPLPTPLPLPLPQRSSKRSQCNTYKQAFIYVYLDFPTRFAQSTRPPKTHAYIYAPAQGGPRK